MKLAWSKSSRLSKRVAFLVFVKYSQMSLKKMEKNSSKGNLQSFRFSFYARETFQNNTGSRTPMGSLLNKVPRVPECASALRVLEYPRAWFPSAQRLWVSECLGSFWVPACHNYLTVWLSAFCTQVNLECPSNFRVPMERVWVPLDSALSAQMSLECSLS